MTEGSGGLLPSGAGPDVARSGAPVPGPAEPGPGPGAAHRKVCLATVTTDGFLPGTLVMVASFLKAHPGFDGDVVVIHDGLSEEAKACLGALHHRVRFETPSAELGDRLARVGAAHPRFAPILCHLHALEAYRLAGYRKVLLCDGDLLFRQPIDELFDTQDLLLCCPDRVFLAGRCRDAATFMPVAAPSCAGAAGVLERTFNDGFLVLDGSAAGERCYAELLALVAPATWRDNETPHFKQFVHNRYFAGRQTLISSAYNYILLAASAIRAREGLAAADAKVLHFNLDAKPWRPATMLRWMNGGSPVPEFRLWYDAWMDSLSVGHLRAAKQSSRWVVVA